MYFAKLHRTPSHSNLLISFWDRLKSDMVNVMLGYGFMAELTQEEAFKFCKNKVKILEKRNAFFESRSQTIQEHMRQLLTGVEELRQSVMNISV